ncbi:MAG: CpsD/CapB family tyrosine-protein kinase [Proteobacteria bacterium]|nr:CpsD/CapB family tyrosine-protein kinase [Pseudomonadota bacterium]MBU1736870.1 CpsD/CapB family tyrosine-protein kinase [Pseudomonadota bacterium]
MKIQATLDKAKANRGNMFAETPGQKAAGGEDGSAFDAVVNLPEYSKSRHVRFVPDVLEKNRCVSIFPDAEATNSYKMLKKQIQQKTEGDRKNTIMITGVREGDGSSLTSANLAVTFARELHQTVLLVDCDLRSQKIHKCFGYESRMGLADYLTDNKALSELIVWPGIEKLTVISGGQDLPDSTEFLGSKRMGHLVDEMKNRYEERYVLFDVPPVLDRADALAFSPFVDGIVMVVSVGKTSRRDIKRALGLFDREKIIGLVLNRITH